GAPCISGCTRPMPSGWWRERCPGRGRSMTLLASFRYFENSCLLLFPVALLTPAIVAVLARFRYPRIGGKCTDVLVAFGWVIGPPLVLPLVFLLPKRASGFESLAAFVLSLLASLVIFLPVYLILFLRLVFAI